MYDQKNEPSSVFNPLKAIHNAIFMIRHNSHLIFTLRLSWFLILFLVLWPIPIYILAVMMLTGCSAWILKSNGDLWNPAHDIRRMRHKNRYKQRNRRIEYPNQERACYDD